MQVKYNVTGARRKELVKVISDTTGAKAEYKFMPTCNYEIDYFTVTKDGTLLFDDRADSEEVEQVLEAIAAAGFECEAQDEESDEAAETEAQADVDGLTVEMPRSFFTDAALDNLKRPRHRRSSNRGDGREGFLPLVHRDRAGCGTRLHQLHQQALRDGEERHEGDGDRKGGRQREVRIPLLSPPPRLYRSRLQDRQKNPAEEPHGLLGIQKRRCGS